MKFLSLDWMSVLFDCLSNIHLTNCYILPVGVRQLCTFFSNALAKISLKNQCHAWNVVCLVEGPVICAAIWGQYLKQSQCVGKLKSGLLLLATSTAFLFQSLRDLISQNHVKSNANNVDGKIIMDFKVAYMNFLFVTLIDMWLSTYQRHQNSS